MFPAVTLESTPVNKCDSYSSEGNALGQAKMPRPT
jgi:hypothetical protein